MRLGTMLDPVYLLSSLWGGNVNPQACVSHLPISSRPSVQLAPAWASQDTVDVTAFVNVAVIPMDAERVLPGQTVLIRGGRILALGPVGKVPVPVGARQIDGRDRYLMPGLTDMHEHSSGIWRVVTDASIQDHLFRTLASGITAIRHLQGPSVGPEQLGKHFKTAEIPIPRLYIPPKIPKSTRLDSMTAVVAASKAAGYDHVSVTPSLRLRIREESEVFDSLLVAVRRADLPMSVHIDFLAFESVLRLGAIGGAAEHLYSFMDALGYHFFPPRDSLGVRKAPTSVPEVSASELQVLIAAARRAGVWITPTLQCTEDKWPSVTPTHLKVMRQLVRGMQAAGVGLLLGGDDGWTVHEELRALVRAGLSPYQALRTGTYNVADFLKLLDSSGTVAVGRRADLLLLSGNPLLDIRHAREPDGVMIDGRWFDRAALDRQLLASPKAWLQSIVMKKGIRSDDIKPHASTLTLLIDSLEAVLPSQRASSEHLRRRLAEELGALRARLTAEQHEMFDPLVRTWVREQERQGVGVEVSGVTR